MRPFDYKRAATIQETITLLDSAPNGHIRPLAGGTDLLPLLKAEQLLDIKRINELPQGIVETADGITLGALTTLAEIEQSELLRHSYPLLAEAAGSAATPQLRNMATLGGNLLQRPRCWYFRNHHIPCWLKGSDNCPAKEGENQLHALFGGGPCYAVHPSDLASALLALDATVQLRGKQGERTLPLGEFFALPTAERRQETIIAPDELLTAVHLPPMPDTTRSIYLKAMARKVWAFALVGVAAVLRFADNHIADARIVLSGVAPMPWRAVAAEHALIGVAANSNNIASAVAAALQDTAPLRQNQYKVPLAKGLLQQALMQLHPEA